MYEIKCPNCGEVFQVERAAYAEIVEQVRNEQFNAELEERIRTVREKMEAEQRATLMLQEQELKDKINEKEQEISRLNEQAKGADDRTALAVADAEKKKDSESCARSSSFS